MPRAFILVMDSFGIGAAPDAVRFGDVGADTFGHIVEACAKGEADRAGVRQGPLQIPRLTALGLGAAAAEARGAPLPGIAHQGPFRGIYAHAAEQSLGKDTPSGHWEMAGVPVMFDWGYFPKTVPTFPQPLIDEFMARARLPGVLGNCHASGTVIIDELGEEHIRTGKPIVYTSADSVFQIAAHETHFGLQRLYEISKIARELVDGYNIGRVIARPFVGDAKGAFRRTGNRKDLAVPPPAPTLLDRLTTEGGQVLAIGKIADIFAHQGISEEIKAEGNDALMQATIAAARRAPDRSLIFTNFVDFDMLYGHRRDVAGYAKALEDFDKSLGMLDDELQPGDQVIITADHGCDPTWPGSDHTREFVPALLYGPGVKPRNAGRRESFADIGQTLAGHLGLGPLKHGRSMI